MLHVLRKQKKIPRNIDLRNAVVGFSSSKNKKIEIRICVTCAGFSAPRKKLSLKPKSAFLVGGRLLYRILSVRVTSIQCRLWCFPAIFFN